MLRFLREKGNSWLLKGLLGFVALTFVTWGGFSVNSQKVVSGGRVAAWVNETPITIREFENHYYQQAESMRRQLGAAFTPELEKRLNLRRATFQQLVQEKLQLEEAKRLGIEISDGEVAYRIQETPSFQVGGQYDEARYKRVLQDNRLRRRQFEERQRRALAVLRLRDYIGLGASINNSEIDAAFRWENEQIRVDILPVKPEFLSAGISSKPEEIKAYYEKNKQAFRLGERRKAQWWYLPYEAVSKDYAFKDEALKTHYRESLSRYKQKESVTISQILLKVAPDAKKEAFEKAKSKLSALLRKKILGGESFAELAKANSEGPAASKGGELGTYERGQILPEIEKVVFSQKEGEVSEPIQTSFGVHLIRVNKRNPAATLSFEAVRVKVEASLRDKRARVEAKEKLRLIRYDFEDKKTETPLAGLNKGETGYFELKRAPASVPEGNLFLDLVSALSKAGGLSSEKAGNKGVMFVHLVDVKPSEDAAFKDVQERVRAQVLKEKSAQAADKKSGVWLDELKADKRKFNELAKELKVKISSPKAFTRGGAPGSISGDVGAEESLFKLKNGGFARVRSGGVISLVRVAEKTLADMSKLEEQHKTLRKKLVQERKRLLFLRRMDILRKAAKVRLEEGFAL